VDACDVEECFHAERLQFVFPQRVSASPAGYLRSNETCTASGQCCDMPVGRFVNKRDIYVPRASARLWVFIAPVGELRQEFQCRYAQLERVIEERDVTIN